MLRPEPVRTVSGPPDDTASGYVAVMSAIIE